MSTPIRKEYPAAGPLAKHTPPPGQQLFNDVTEFYCWYVSSWYMPDGHSEMSKKGDATRKILSLIKRIAEVSINGGQFLTETEASKAVNELNNVIQDLNSGQLRKKDLPEALLQVMVNLTEQNPKAKVVCQTTELEYRLCINPPANQTSEVTAQYQKALANIIQGIPKMRDINASAISQGLSQILDNSSGMKNVAEAINQAVKHWL
jgi:hypothetical protein